ncbi:MAG: hypothetical protein IT449_06740 [Phycisphaerales bacterium]|nr:hypothetical protein [Phycisphaerales bacterium]
MSKDRLQHIHDAYDVIGLTRCRRLSKTFARELNSELRATFRKLVKAIEAEDEAR